MKRFSKWLLPLYIFLFFSLCLPILTHAQGPGGGDVGCDPGDPTCPIDGGLTALLAVGVVYGIKKVRDSRKEEV